MSLCSRAFEVSVSDPLETIQMSAPTIDRSSDWSAFVAEVQERILPRYKEHEKTFDPFGAHGRIHICRSVIFAEWMARTYAEHLPGSVDFYAIRVATAMHDVGRRANGPDLWENDSVRACREYVTEYGRRDGEYPQYVANLIDKRPSDDVNKWIVHDADVLEIMRPCCGHGGINGFKRDFLYFACAPNQLPNAAELRENLIREAWEWIAETERIKLKLFNSSTFLTDLLHKLADERLKYPILSSLT